MRVSTSGAFRDGVRAMQTLAVALGETQRRISSGRRNLRPSDDPVAAARSVGFREAISRLEQYQRNGNAARARLEHEESGLISVTNVLQRARELVLRASNATESAETRKIFAIELREQLESLMQTANQRDGNGRFLFAGNQDGSQPVSRNASGFLYNGDQGERVIRIGATRLVSDGDSGAAVFFDIRNGNGTFRTSADATNTGTGVLGTGNLVDPSLYDKGQYTVRFIDPDNYEVLDSAAVVIATGTYQSGESIAFRGISFSIEGAPAAGDEFLVEPSRYQSMFQTLQNIVDVLESSSNNTVDTVTLRNRLNAGLQEIDQSLLNVSAVRTKIGIRLNAIDSQLDNNSAASILAQQAVSELEDLDYAQALSTLSLQAVVLEAAQQSFVLTQRLSLFRFL